MRETSNKDQCEPPSARSLSRLSLMGRNMCVTPRKLGRTPARLLMSGDCIKRNVILGRNSTIRASGYLGKISLSSHLRRQLALRYLCKPTVWLTPPKMKCSVNCQDREAKREQITRKHTLSVSQSFFSDLISSPVTNKRLVFFGGVVMCTRGHTKDIVILKQISQLREAERVGITYTRDMGPWVTASTVLV